MLINCPTFLILTVRQNNKSMKIPRRLFIKNTSVGLFSIALLNPFKQLWALTKNENAIPPSWEKLVEIARWCPTVHNLQPHQVKIISETEAELFYNPERLLPLGDPNSIFATVAMGIFVEYLSIASSSFGFKVNITKIYNPITTKSKGPTLFGKLELSPSSKKETLGVELIKKRRTSRVAYNGQALKKKTVEILKAQAEKFNQELFHSSDQKYIDLIVELNQETLFEDLESKPNREELDKLFRYSKKDAKTKKDGLWAQCMGFSGILLKSVFQHHEKWTKGIRKILLKENYKSSFDGTQSICWIGGKFENTKDWFDSGKYFARSWLLLTKEGAYLQPTGSLITNKGAYEKMKAILTQPKNGKTIWLAYRAGYSKEPARSYRLDTDEILIK